ncbi:MAG: hypothetical protein ACK53Y_07350 [bacterium]
MKYSHPPLLTDRPEALMTKLAMVLIALANSQANSSFPPGGWSRAGACAPSSPISVKLDPVPASCDCLRPGLSSLDSAAGSSPTSHAASSLPVSCGSMRSNFDG